MRPGSIFLVMPAAGCMELAADLVERQRLRGADGVRRASALRAKCLASAATSILFVSDDVAQCRAARKGWRSCVRRPEWTQPLATVNLIRRRPSMTQHEPCVEAADPAADVQARREELRRRLAAQGVTLHLPASERTWRDLPRLPVSADELSEMVIRMRRGEP